MNLWSILKASSTLQNSKSSQKSYVKYKRIKETPFVTDYVGNDTHKMFEHFSTKITIFKSKQFEASPNSYLSSFNVSQKMHNFLEVNEWAEPSFLL